MVAFCDSEVRERTLSLSLSLSLERGSCHGQTAATKCACNLPCRMARCTQHTTSPAMAVAFTTTCADVCSIVWRGLRRP